MELLVCHETEDDPLPVSLAKMDFLRSRLSFESFSDGSKDVDLVSREIKMFDTRYPDEAVNNRPNVFTLVLKPKSKGELIAGATAIRYLVWKNHVFTNRLLVLSCPVSS